MSEWLIILLDKLIVLIWLCGMIKTYIETAPESPLTQTPGEILPRLGKIHELK